VNLLHSQLTKDIALALVFLACGSAGALRARMMLLRVRELEASVRMLAGLRAQLQFSRPPLARMLGACCAASQHPVFLPQALRRMREGAAFPLAWREAVMGHSPGLKEEDRRALCCIGEILGALDAEGQREALLPQEALLQAQLDQARAQRDVRGKAFFLLGILAGLTLMIIFV
jgi:stage III sporulation protein AB